MDMQLIEIETQPEPQASLIILHGLGADGEDFVPFCQALDLEGIGPLRFVLPSAPERPVSLNGGHVMRAWYDILPTDDLARREDEASLRHGHYMVQSLIEREVARGVPASRIVLMGFSQGCAMTLMAGLRCTRQLAGLVALSGYLPLLPTTEAERDAANLHTPIFMAHGLEDDVVVPSRGEAARDHLQALGHTVEWHTYPMDHGLCMPEVQDINLWLKRVLAST